MANAEKAAPASGALRKGFFLALGGGLQILAGRRRLLMRGPATAGFAITLDDGPDPERTPLVSEALLAGGAFGTFFCVGARARKHPEIVRRLARQGHQIGHHTYGHRRLTHLPPAEAVEEIRQGRRALEDILGSRCPCFRPPHGLVPPLLLPAIWGDGDSIVLWNYSSRDYTGLPLEPLRRRLRARGIRAGDIVLMHDVCDTAPELTRIIVEIGRAGGSRPVTIPQMMGRAAVSSSEPE